MSSNTLPKYKIQFHEGYYRVIDAATGRVIPPPKNHYKRYRDGYLYVSAAEGEARCMERDRP